MTEKDLFSLHKFPLLNTEEAFTNLGSMRLLLEILPLMLEHELPAEKHKLQQAYTESNWTTIVSLAHKLKSSAIYCGTQRLKMACEYLERSQKEDLRSEQERLYQQLLKAIDETMTAIREWLINRVISS